MRTGVTCFIACTLSLVAAPALSGNVHYLACRADNESRDSIIGLDETARRVCDRDAGPKWLTPMAFDAALVEWSDGGSTKSIYRKGRHKHYEHNILLLNHIGHCNKVPTPSTPLCAG
ncbi:MAG: hypothetical protein WC829_22485 [Hyphomicrobium sp.]|jgi:hypothetical protein